jgi:hypothetical protein
MPSAKNSKDCTVANDIEWLSGGWRTFHLRHWRVARLVTRLWRLCLIHKAAPNTANGFRPKLKNPL